MPINAPASIVEMLFPVSDLNVETNTVSTIFGNGYVTIILLNVKLIYNDNCLISIFLISQII